MFSSAPGRLMALIGSRLLSSIAGRTTLAQTNRVSSLRCRSISTSTRALAAQVTQPAPDFRGTAVINGEFKEISLSDFAGKYLVVFFYPLDFTFVCPTEITAFSDRAADFDGLDTSVVAISTDSHYSHLAWTNTPRKRGGLGSVNIPLLSDFCKNISRDYGVLVEEAGMALRGLFIIDDKGVIRHTSVNDFSVGRSVGETLRLVQAFRFTDKHGEVCPAAWTPGGKTIKPNAKDANEYFESVN